MLLTRYIALEVIKGTVFAAFIFLSLLNFFTFADELGDLGTGNYGLKEIMLYLLLSSPHNLYQLIPPSALVGSLMTLGAMASHSELVAIQTAGGSRARIVQAAMTGGLIVALLSMLMGEFVAPVAEQRAQAIKSMAMKHQISSQSRYGFWIRDGSRFVNVRRIHGKSRLGDISLYELDDSGHLLMAMHASTATHNGNRWMLSDINSTSPGHDSATSKHMETLDWDSVLSPDMLNAFVVRPENLSIVELSRYQNYMSENAQQSLAVEQAFWGRLVNPLLTLAMLALALPMIMRFDRNVSTGRRAVTGISLGIGFYLMDRMLSHLGIIYELPPVMTALAPTALVLTAAAVLNHRYRY